jgi:hypothetical protein
MIEHELARGSAGDFLSGEERDAAVKSTRYRLRGRAEFGSLCFGGVTFLKESRTFSLGKMLPAFRIA